MEKQIIIVTSDHCEPCDELKKILHKNDVKFTEYNIDTKMGVSFLDLCKKKDIEFFATPTIITMWKGDYEIIDKKKLFEMCKMDEDVKIVEYTFTGDWNIITHAMNCGLRTNDGLCTHRDTNKKTKCEEDFCPIKTVIV